ncbi:hypothetical protein ACFX13_026909 [Malus domestica]
MGDSKVDVNAKNTVLVTVGTTSFDALVRTVDAHEVKQELSKRGWTRLLIRMGRGFYTPTKNNLEKEDICLESYGNSERYLIFVV